MKIKSIRAWLKNLALSKPYQIANLWCSEVENVFLEIELANGIRGLGSANPAPEVVGETPEQCLIACQSPAFQQIVGRNIEDFKQIIRSLRILFPQSPGSMAALDIALHDAYAQHMGLRIVDLYGQKIESLPTSVTIGIMDVSETLREAADFLSQGFNVLKVKTGMNVEEDIERVRKLYETYGSKIRVRVDTNQGYTLRELLRFLEGVKGLPLELIEQPLPPGSEQDLLSLDPDIRKILVADESLKSPASARELAGNPKPFGVFNIKLMKCGGILTALDIAQIAQKAHIDLFWGCNDESRVSISAALNAAFACSNTRYLDLDGSFDLAEDVVEGGFELKEGRMWCSAIRSASRSAMRFAKP